MDLVYQVNGAAIEVHKSISPGLLESVYHQYLKKALEILKINYSTGLLVPLIYKGHELESKLRCDLFLENILVVELKLVNDIHPIFEAQLLTYINLLNTPIGLLINFNVKNIFYDGQKTWVNQFYSRLEE
jgi:GxxExxY protein